MDSLRLFLLFIGVVIVIAIYAYEKARRNKSDGRYSRWGGAEEKDFIPRGYASEHSAKPADTPIYNDNDEPSDDLEEDYDDFDEGPSKENALKDITDELQQLEGIIASKDDEVVEQLEIDGFKLDNEPEDDSAPAEPDMVIVINLFATDGRVLTGPDILDAAMKHDLQFGEMGFFHRLDESGTPLFSMANALQPGSFELGDMESLATRGLVYFMSLPSPGDPLENFDSMMATIRDMGGSLHAQLHDDTRSVLTRQGVDEIRTRISEYKLKSASSTETA